MIFAWSSVTPSRNEDAAAIKDLNLQGENNVHNLIGYFADHLFIAAVLMYESFLVVRGRH